MKLLVFMFVDIGTNVSIIFLTVINRCYEYTDEDRIWRVTRTESEKGMCERHKHNIFLTHGKEGAIAHGCGNGCSCCARVEGSLSEISL